MIITIQDLRACRMCRKGARLFFDKHGLNWADFSKNGIEEERLLATGDALAVQLVEGAHNGRR